MLVFFPLILLFLCSSVESGGNGCGLISKVTDFNSLVVLHVPVGLLEMVCGLLAALVGRFGEMGSNSEYRLSLSGMRVLWNLPRWWLHSPVTIAGKLYCLV